MITASAAAPTTSPTYQIFCGLARHCIAVWIQRASIAPVAERGELGDLGHLGLDGDSEPGPGYVLWPGEDAPEQVVFKALKGRSWGNLWARIGRDTSAVEDACIRAMTLSDHHDWVRFAANQRRCGGSTLWQAMCAEWTKSLTTSDTQSVLDAVSDALP